MRSLIHCGTCKRGVIGGEVSERVLSAQGPLPTEQTSVTTCSCPTAPNNSASGQPGTSVCAYEGRVGPSWSSQAPPLGTDQRAHRRHKSVKAGPSAGTIGLLGFTAAEDQEDRILLFCFVRVRSTLKTPIPASCRVFKRHAVLVNYWIAKQCFKVE